MAQKTGKPVKKAATKSGVTSKVARRQDSETSPSDREVRLRQQASRNEASRQEAARSKSFQAPKSAAQNRLDKEFPLTQQEEYFRLANAVPIKSNTSAGEVLYSLLAVAFDKVEAKESGKQYRKLPANDRRIYDIIASVVREKYVENPSLIVEMTNKATSPLDKED